MQGHTDMVCEKNKSVEHDFLTDPIRLVLDGDRLRADGTTLGADDGIAVAVMLAVLDGEVKSHPTVECLFTSSEEIGLDGATNFDYSNIRAKALINMDSEDIGVVTAGCAGGVRTDVTFDLSPEPVEGELLRVFLSGLSGGHSGADIHKGRANANRLMGRLLAALGTENFRLVRIEGGLKENAIPRECEAVIAVRNRDEAEDLLTEEGERIAGELGAADRGFRLTVEDAPEPEAYMLAQKDTDGIVTLLTAARNGVLEMNRDVPGLVEYSRNLGVIRFEGERVVAVLSTRSGIEARLDESIRELDLLCRAIGAGTRHHNRYPGWAFAPASKLRDLYLEAYRAVTGTDARVNATHAGLECGLIRAKVPGMDAISVGPELHQIHSPDESMELPSVDIFLKTIVYCLEKIK